MRFAHRQLKGTWKVWIGIGLLGFSGFQTSASADEWGEAVGLMRESRVLEGQGKHFSAARYAFAASQVDASYTAESDAQIAVSLIHAHLENAASYFFIRTLQSGNKTAIRKVLTESQALLDAVGVDLLRDYLIRHTQYSDYDEVNRSAYLYALAKEAVLNQQESKAIEYVNGMSKASPLWPYGLEIRGTAAAVMGKNAAAVDDFKLCQSQSSMLAKEEAFDLKNRCLAGQARTLYQMDQFDESDQVYDLIAKSSFSWPEILFEQAWVSFARGEYNRTLGKLVSYKSPALKFLFNSEVDVLRAQAYLALCLYDDANKVIQEFVNRYTPVGLEIKTFVEKNASNIDTFYETGKASQMAYLHEAKGMGRVLNRFTRSPYFQGLVRSERAVQKEQQAAEFFAKNAPGGGAAPGKGFVGFLDQILSWRLKSIRHLGGAYVKNSLIDHHQVILSDFDKMSFIKLEMLKLAKEELMRSSQSSMATEERGRGNMVPQRRDYQYYWAFNGEFWNDELGDYIFGLESRCKANGGEK